MVLGILAGLLWGPRMLAWDRPTRLIVELIQVLAMPLILVSIILAVVSPAVSGSSFLKLARLLAINTGVALLIGLGLVKAIRPGEHFRNGLPALPPPSGVSALGTLFEAGIPKSVLGPLTDSGTGRTLSVICLAVFFGLALRRNRTHSSFNSAVDLLGLALAMLESLLRGVVELLPLAVFGVIASKVGNGHIAQFYSLFLFVLCVTLGLAAQIVWYLVRIRLGSWARPWQVVRACRDALLTALSTASTTATIPITLDCLTRRLGLRQESARLGALVGTNLNNDGTALYEAVAALFVAQLAGIDLSWGQQLLMMAIAMAAATGAAGIPEGGTVTLAMVLSSVHLPLEFLPLLLTVDWFVDRCRTMVNVFGDINVSCLLDGKSRGSLERPT